MVTLTVTVVTGVYFIGILSIVGKLLGHSPWGIPFENELVRRVFTRYLRPFGARGAVASKPGYAWRGSCFLANDLD